jgi:hypothetical protein
VGDLYIVLGCFGRTDDDFVSCSGLKNRILHITPEDSNYLDLMNYLDNMQLFDKVMMDYNAVRHFIFNIQNKFELPTRKVWSEKMFLLYQKFVIDHKDCGLFIDLELDGESEEIS